MRVYLSGPMTGIQEFNVPEFHMFSALLELRGYEVFSPARLSEDRYGKTFWHGLSGDPEELKARIPEFSLEDSVIDDVDAICASQAVAFMPGWEKSRGCAWEHAMAVALGRRLIYL